MKNWKTSKRMWKKKRADEEAIAGYVLLQVDDLDEAVEIAKEWPVLEIYGVSIEVRPVNAG
jgi:hypothetical protein